MKKRLLGGFALLAFLAGPAMAADLPVKTPIYKAPLPTPVAYSWSGIYVGLNAGYGWADNASPFITFTDLGGNVGFADYFAAGGRVYPNLKPRGFVGGGQIGADGQWGNLVAGVVVDFQGADINASGAATVAPAGFVPTTQSLSQKLDFLGTARARAGLAWDNWLAYGTGGFAYGHVNSSLSHIATTGFGGAGVSLINSNSQNLTGWAAGAGVNYGFANWVVGLEWLHYDLGHSTTTAFTVPPGVIEPGSSLTTTQRVAGDIVRGTLSYKFNWGPVVAKY